MLKMRNHGNSATKIQKNIVIISASLCLYHVIKFKELVTSDIFSKSWSKSNLLALSINCRLRKFL